MLIQPGPGSWPYPPLQWRGMGLGDSRSSGTMPHAQEHRSLQGLGARGHPCAGGPILPWLLLGSLSLRPRGPGSEGPGDSIPGLAGSRWAAASSGDHPCQASALLGLLWRQLEVRVGSASGQGKVRGQHTFEREERTSQSWFCPPWWWSASLLRSLTVRLCRWPGQGELWLC